MNVKTPRRWLSFSLRTMFIVVTAICCWLGWESSVVRGRQALLKELRTRPFVSITTADQWAVRFPAGMPAAPVRDHRASVSLVRGWLGDEAIAAEPRPPRFNPSLSPRTCSGPSARRPANC